MFGAIISILLLVFLEFQATLKSFAEAMRDYCESFDTIEAMFII